MSVLDDAGVTEIARGGGIAAWRQIADDIEADIASGALTPGMQLPTESQLAARFAVNRHTVRRALAELATRGLVRATQGRGTFVEARPLAYPISARTRFSENVSRAGREASGKLLDAVVMTADAMVAAALAIPLGAPVIRLDTVRLADGSPISYGHGFFPLPRFERLGDAYRAYGTITRALESRGVSDYRRLETRISARPAHAEEAAKLDLAPGRLLLTVDSINVDATGMRIQFTRAAFSADRTELVVES
ncbi:phosphonate metabolism transcriptional regulator PhnF [Kaistia dalseonensis]|uniref:GntR family phosphonate transport system transcriptional regulator n=1 Tax=Kaistia dalseonensis TaxID=410840 RepID=A0ABU0H8E9_9HYPH|nr:phosphonate metabolism transcriptional regulator PhnF [Kaistia dalseonensis]MCX5495989.1 phosphonate metabolism transcriptional regulator PhnF [Kaistia dalseonensis]MDQ0438592.1 GntR family phosphonate transport system transcriptional regulator [Kaistia dalseonensis]